LNGGGWSACIEWLFAAEAPDSFPDRIRLAKAAGFDAVEFWRHTNKDLPAIRAALDETGIKLAGILCEPKASLTDRAQHPAFLESVRVSLAAAKTLGTRMMIAQSGDLLPDVPRAEQHRAVVDALWEAGKILDESGVFLAIEPLNDRIDHKGYYLTSTAEGLDIIDEVAVPEIKLLYDIYHAAVMGEGIELAGRIDRVIHVHLADTDGRHEPGTGSLDYKARVDWLRAHGYRGYIGLEYKPTVATVDSLKALFAAIPR
jgi:hydroxypyruvate isomerase